MGETQKQSMREPWKESEYWDNRFRSCDTPWEILQPSPTLMHIIDMTGLKKRSSILFPGCGRGEDPLHFCRQGFQVSAVDFAVSAIEDVRVLARRELLNIELLVSNFFEIPRTWHNTFDLVMDHTFLCAIDASQREEYVQQVLRLLKPEGQFGGALYVCPEDREPEEFMRELWPKRKPPSPPFLMKPSTFRELFEKDFDLLTFEPSPVAPTELHRRFEWMAHFRRK